jgi:competence protein ComEC
MPLFWLSLAFLSGIILSDLLRWSLVTWFFITGTYLVILISRLLLKRFVPGVSLFRFNIPFLHQRLSSLSLPTFPVPIFIVLLALFLGGARYQLVQPTVDESFVAWYNDRPGKTVIEGVLISPPDIRDKYTNLKIRCTQLRSTDESSFTAIEGLLLAKVANGSDWHYGDLLSVEGLLETAPENEEFSYREYLARKNIHSYMPQTKATLLQHNQGNMFLSLIFRLKEIALKTVYQLYPDPEASLLAGILLGVESGIPEDVQQAFRDTGTSHIIAISGFNITIIAGLLATIFSRLIGHGRKGARWGALFALIGIITYTILVGGDAAVVRAAIMGGLTLLAMQLGRRQDGINSLAVVAAIMAMINPNVLWDVGFQLSFAATLGLVMFAEPFQNAFINVASRRLPSETAQRLSGPIGEYLLFTLAATLLTLPITLYHFQRLSLTALLANPLILPVQPPVMLLGGMAVILGMVYQPLGQLVAYLAYPFVAYTIHVVELLAKIPHGVITLGRISLLIVVLFYIFLIGWFFAGSHVHKWLKNRNIELPSKTWALALGLVGILTIYVWQVAFTSPDGRLHLTVLNVGTGDALLVQSPTGRYLLIDGGPSSRRLSEGLGRRLSPANRKLDYIVIGATEDEQIAALPSIIERFPPANVLWSGPRTANFNTRVLRKRLTEMGSPIITARPGQTLDLGDGATLRVLAITKRGAVYMLEWQNFRALLPIGIDFDSMARLQKHHSSPEITVLLLSDGGYAPVNPPSWIAYLKPRLILLSVGGGNSRDLPDTETLEAIEGYNLFRTDVNGWIHLATDGEHMWVEVERK